MCIRDSKKTKSRFNRRNGSSALSSSSVKVSSPTSSTASSNVGAIIKKSSGSRSPNASETKIGVMSDGTQAVIASNQLNVAKGGDTVNSTNVGGNSTTFNIVNGGGNSLANSGHLPVTQAV